MNIISISKINVDGSTQMREGLVEETIIDYTEAMQNGANFPPITVFEENGSYWLADGFHRVEAAKRAGKTDIDAEIISGNQREALLHAIGANSTHGLRRTNADKRKAVLTIIRDPEWAKWNNCEIARRCGVVEGFVRKIKEEINQSKQIAPNSYSTTNEKTSQQEVEKAASMNETGESTREASSKIDSAKPTETEVTTSQAENAKVAETIEIDPNDLDTIVSNLAKILSRETVVSLVERLEKWIKDNVERISEGLEICGLTIEKSSNKQFFQAVGKGCDICLSSVSNPITVCEAKKRIEKDPHFAKSDDKQKA